MTDKADEGSHEAIVVDPNVPLWQQVVDPRAREGMANAYAVFSKEMRERAMEERKLQPGDDFNLPIDQRIEQSLITEGVEFASTEKHIPESNIGYKMLAKMGWKGGGLGKDGTGIAEPIRGGSELKVRFGLGKEQEIEFYTKDISRRLLESEVEETEEIKQKREEAAGREEALKEHLTEMKSTFLCQLCNKQYKLARELEVHLSSYDHHHKKRLIEMKAAFKEDDKDRAKREKKREDKEMARFAQLVKEQPGGGGGGGGGAGGGGAAAAGVGAGEGGAAVAGGGTAPVPLAKLPADRAAIKIGFGGGAKGGLPKKGAFGFGKKPLAPTKKVAALFAAESSDEEDAA